MVRNLRVQAHFQCGQRDDAAVLDAAAYGYPALSTTAAGHFSLTTYVLDQYQSILAITITGNVRGAAASGRISVSEPPGGFTGPAGEDCSGNYA